MTEISRLTGGSDAIELDFVEREATSIELMELARHAVRDPPSAPSCGWSIEPGLPQTYQE